MNKKEAILNYENYQKVNNMYKYAIASISYDDATGAPSKSFNERNDVLNYFSMLLFNRSISKEYEQIINDLNRYYKSLSLKYQRILDLSLKELRLNKKVPVQVMEEYKKACSDAVYYWNLAKSKSDYQIYKPYLKKVLEKQIEVGNYMKDESTSLFDTYLDMYEEDITEVELDEFFNKLKARIVPLLQKIMKSDVVIRDDFLRRKISKEDQDKMGRYIASLIGFDFSRGLARESEHPFTNEISPNDVRITTHFYLNNFTSNLFSMAHEGGHGIYEQNVSKRLAGSILQGGASMAVHESESRLFENIITRSEAFCSYYFKDIQKMAHGKLDDVTYEEYYKAINKVEPSFIRTEADELTYCLHIMVRYEMEKLMINNMVDYDTLNTLWNQKYKEYLGVDVPNDKLGILQDIHWTDGVGYFFSYALGNAYSAQIFNALKKDLDTDSLLRNGNVKPIVSWLRKHIYQYGMLLKPKELIKKATGEYLNVDYYLDYLEEKYSKIYHLK